MNVQKMKETLRLLRYLCYLQKKNIYLCSCFLSNPDIILKEKDEKFSFGGLIGSGSFSMDYFFANSKIFSLHAILLDFAGSVVTSTPKERAGVCFVALILPISCLFGHVTGILFCL